MYLNMERNLNIKDLNVHLTMNIGMLGPYPMVNQLVFIN